jgi:hypothetical protein
MTSNLTTQRSVSDCEINDETITHEFERGRNATGSLVQNLRAGFVPPEPSNPVRLGTLRSLQGSRAIWCREAELRYNALAG